MASYDGERVPLGIRGIVGVSIVLVIIGYVGMLFSILRRTGAISIVASIFLVVVGVSIVGVTVTRREWLNKGSRSYLDTSEGAIVATLVLWLSLLSFAIIIDRTPTSLAASADSPEGLFVASRSEFFPIVFDLSVLLYTGLISVTLVVLGIASSRIARTWLGERRYVLHMAIVLSFSIGIIHLLVLADLAIPGGTEIEGRTPLSIPFLGKVIIETMWLLMLILVPVYTLPLLPEWATDHPSDERIRRELLHDFIDANWRRTRVLTTLILTGAIGTTLPFVFSRTSPYLFFIVAIVGSITLGPLGIVWFLMRRIREAEKELRPT